MIVDIRFNNGPFKADLSKGYDISLPLKAGSEIPIVTGPNPLRWKRFVQGILLEVWMRAEVWIIKSLL